MKYIKQGINSLKMLITLAKSATPFNLTSAPLSTTQKAYVAGAIKKIEGGHKHASLGGNIDNEAKQKALASFTYLRDLGIDPSDVVVDYGCGTLRVGKHFIDYLNSGNYIGMDLDRRILSTGLKLLDPCIIQKKTPTLTTITQSALKATARRNPRLVFAKGVVQHVPPGELNRFFHNVAAIGHSSLIVLAIKFSDTSEQLSKRSWKHSHSDILKAASKARLSLIHREDNWHHFKTKDAI